MKMAQAIVMMHERKAFGHAVNAREIARRHGVNYGSLRDAYWHFRHGRVDMPVKPTTLDELADRRALYEKMRMLSNRLTAMVASQLEDALTRAEMESGLAHTRLKDGKKVSEKEMAGEVRNYRQINSDVNFLSRSLASAINLAGMVDEGYSSHLDESQRRLNPPPPVNPILPVGGAKQTAMLNAGETNRALEALELEVVKPGEQ